MRRRELSVVRTQLAAVVDERNGLREDLRGVRERCEKDPVLPSH